MQQPLASRTRDLLVGLLTGHATLRAHLYNLGLAEQKNCRLCGEEREDSIRFLCHCPALVLKRYKSWGKMFLCPRDINKVKVGSLSSRARPSSGMSQRNCKI
ncbi:hypothetical protein WH47_10408 [Habropoda laboriosa]|uniref:Reverse transcriptase zinc-binding domain-containing protein n=1 Tax=Habropoda laboriosa TaxID=597456 RepID=A0A0L7QJL9_9HYME|nr:hypothetical protein WH47_10408 [Habropoda laboriosa]